MSYPYLARTTVDVGPIACQIRSFASLKYKSPHATDLSFAKDETIRVTGPSAEDEDWLVGETLDGSKQGGFPKDFVTAVEEPDMEAAPPTPSAPAPTTTTVGSTSIAADPAPAPVDAPAPPSPKVQPLSLPPSTTSSPAPPSAPQPAGGQEDSPSKQSMKDRLAFFAAAQNKPAPPPIKPKPAAGGLTWSQRQKMRQEQEAKEKESGEGPPAPASPAPATVQSTAASTPPATQKSEFEKKEDAKNAGLSAADAQNSISKGGSLRERMAALQGAGAFGAAAEKKPVPPTPSGKVWHRPPAADPEPVVEGEEAGELLVMSTQARTPGVEEGDALAAARENEGEGEEETEEERDKAKRAAIAARMARLGARGPMGMAAPPKPTRKPTREAITVSAPHDTAEATQAGADVPTQPIETAAPVSSPPTSIPIPSMPRRTAPPRRKGPAASTDTVPPGREDSAQPVDPAATRSPPPQVMVADEERPLPRTAEQLEAEGQKKDLGRGPRGAEGAVLAGISISPALQAETTERSDRQLPPPLAGALGTAGSGGRGVGPIPVPSGVGSIIDEREDEIHEVEDGVEEGGYEKDGLMREAERGDLEFEEPADENEVAHPQPISMVPLHPPAEGGPTQSIQEESPPPPPPRMVGMPLDEVELKHEHDAALARDGADDLGPAPPPPARRPISTDRPLGPRPLPSPARSTQGYAPEDRPLPAPPTHNPMIPPRDTEEEDREADGYGDEEEVDADEEEEAPAPLPPPRRQRSLPAPLQMGLPTFTAQQESPISQSPISTRVVQTAPPPLPTSPPPHAVPSSATDDAPSGSTEDDEEKTRRSGIAARMAKLGGVKFGMPPTHAKRQSTSSADSRAMSEGPKSPIDAPHSPLGADPPMSSPTYERRQPSEPSLDVATGDETPEAEAARKRATLARLRAGGALGFGMFNHGPDSPSTEMDSRGIEEEYPSPIATGEAPPVPGGRPGGPPPAEPLEEYEEEADTSPTTIAPPPIPIGRPMPQAALEEDAPPPPPRTTSSQTQDASRLQPSPAPTLSNPRPSLPPVEKRMSQQSRPIPTVIPENQALGPSVSQASDYQMRDEPAVLMMDQPEFASSPPAPPPMRPAPIQTPSQSPHPPRRSMSNTSHASRLSMEQGMSPASRQNSRQDTDPSRPSFSSNRPGFNELQQASREHGSRLFRAARSTFDQGRKAYFGDGSAAGFVLVAMDSAQISRPQQAWGLLVFEQEGPSVLKRYDEPRPGDIAAFHDAKLKGKKGLASYNQHVGSVEEPLVGVVAEFDVKNKHKVRVLQVERGVPEEMSYRCDDLKSGRILVYRPGIA